MSVTSKEPYQLIIAVVDSGYFGQVMEAAKAAGASGGTLIHARSLGSKEAEKYLGLTLQPEKELVLILAPQEKRHAIMESITAETGLNTEARGSCFSLPVNSVMGVDATIENFNERSLICKAQTKNSHWSWEFCLFIRINSKQLVYRYKGIPL